MSYSDRAEQWTVRVGALFCLASAPACPADTQAQPTTVHVDVERWAVDLREDDLALGGEAPLVTIVMFSDYACNPCGRTWQVLRNLVEDYGEDLRVVYRSYTVAGHLHGERAAEAAFAADAQGKFWEMHWSLFQDTDQFSRPSLRAHAEAVGLDVPRFFDDLDTGAFSGRRMRDRRQATELGIRALPVAFVNGLLLMGAQTDEAAWHALVDEEIRKARELERQGTPRDRLYAAIQAGARRGPVGETDDAKALRSRREAERGAQAELAKAALASPDPGTRYAVPTDGAAAQGPADAPVEIVEFVDFQCPYCRQAATDILPALREAYGDDLRLVVRHLPLEIHPVARAASRAALAADRQGAFWGFHDALWRSDGGLGRQRFLEIAGELRLDVARFEKDFDDPALDAQVGRDIDLSRVLGVHGTPGFFVNGRYVHGARDLSTYRALIDEDLARAARLRAAGTPRAGVRAALMADALGPDRFPNASAGAAGGPVPSPTAPREESHP
jgi:protein-disulfide isomerase